jgi:hypothetical protein
MKSITLGILGLAVGTIIGFLLTRGRAILAQAQLDAAKGSITALEKQIATMQGAQTETTRLATELEAMKKSVESLSTQAREAELNRVTAEQKIRNDLTNMATTNKSLLEETSKIAGALSSSQTRGKFGEAQLEQLLENAGLIEGVHFTRQKSISGFLAPVFSSSTQSFLLNDFLMPSTPKISWRANHFWNNMPKTFSNTWMLLPSEDMQIGMIRRVSLFSLRPLNPFSPKHYVSIRICLKKPLEEALPWPRPQP